MTPLEGGRYTYTVSDPANSDEILGLAIFAIGRSPELRRILERSIPINDPARSGGVVDLWKVAIERNGFEAFAQSDETMMTFLSTILRAYSGSVSGNMSDGTQQWLFGRTIDERTGEAVFSTDSSRVAQTLLADMPRGRRQWLEDNYQSFMNASVFYAWATTQMGMNEAVVSDIGRRMYGGIWDYATAVGKNLEFEDGKWILHTSDRERGWEESTVNLAMRDMRAVERQLGAPRELAPPQTGATALSATPVRMDLATEFADLYGESIRVSNTSERVFLEGLGWGSSYSGLFAGHNMETVLEAATFYSWATRTREADPAEVERLGRQRYGPEWALARVIGEYIEPSRANKNNFVVKTGRADDLQVALDIYAAGVPAEAPAGAPGAVVAEAGEFADIAARYDVSEEFLRRAVELIDRYGTVRVSFNRSDIAEEGMDEGMSGRTPWLRYHPPNGQTSHADTELYAAAREAAELRGITFRTA